jgi:anti-anti-sigma factor
MTASRPEVPMAQKMSRSVSDENRMPVSIQNGKHAGRSYTLVTPAGRAADAEAWKHLTAVLADQARRHPQYLIVDLAQLESADPHTLHELVRASHIVRGLGGGLALACPRPQVEGLLRHLGVDRLIPLYGSLEEALAG